MCIDVNYQIVAATDTRSEDNNVCYVCSKITDLFSLLSPSAWIYNAWQAQQCNPGPDRENKGHRERVRQLKLS